MSDLQAAIRKRLQLEDDHESMSGKSFALIGTEAAQAALLAVLDVHGSYDTDPCLKLEDGAWWDSKLFEDCPTVRLIAEKLGIET